jgi:GT2 family glycosyltransferase
MAATIDVIIPTYNRPRGAEQVAASIRRQLGAGDTLCVVWQGNSKPSIDITETSRLVGPARAGLPAARNAGVRATKGDIILFLDDDVVVDAGLLEAHRSAYDNPTVGGVAGSLDDPNFVPTNPIVASFDETTGRLFQNFCGVDSGPTISVMGANMSFRRTALEKIGLFDENFLHNALFEEVDAAFRIRGAGYVVWYCSNAHVKHLRETQGGCRSDSRLEYMYHQFANTAYFAARHAPARYRRSWYTYWKYRLEYECRRRSLWMKHDPLLAAAAILGACSGIARYALWGKRSTWARVQ